MSMVLNRDDDWSIVDGRVCRVIRFNPLAKIERRKIVCMNRTAPYAFIELECAERSVCLPPNTAGSVVHKLDFIHLWNAFVDRGIDDDETLAVVWSKNYSKTHAKIFSAFMPRLTVLIFKNYGYNLLLDPSFEPSFRGEERFRAERPVAQWTPKALS